MAGAGYKLFNTGDVLTAAQVNTFLMEQTVMVFNDATARTAALSGVVAEGMLSYLKSTKQVEVYNGTAWVASDDPNAIQNTIVDAKGDLITATAADVPARLAVGNNGETLVADSSTATGLRYVPPMANLVNPIINGGFDIWQRGTSIAMASVLQFAPDRWISGRGGWSSGSTVSRQSVNDSTNLPNIRFAMRVQRDSGNTNTQNIFTNTTVESSNAIPYAGRTVTLSFWARAGANFSASGNILNSWFYTGTGIDQNLNTGFTGNTALSGQANTLTTTWQRFAQTFTIGATATEFALEFVYTPVGTAGANDWYEVTGVQLDVGTFTVSSAPAFRRSGGTIQGELAACQRYYYRYTTDATTRVMSFGQAISTTQSLQSVTFPVTMRTRPTALEQSGTAGHYATVNAGAGQNALTAVPAFDGATSNTIAFILTTSAGLVAGNACYLFSANTNAYLGWSAEL